MKNSNNESPQVTRVKRLAVVNYSRAGIPYVKYINPIGKPVPRELHKNVMTPPNRKQRRAEMFAPRVPKGQSFNRGHYQPKPWVAIRPMIKTVKGHTIPVTDEKGEIVMTRCIVIPPVK